MKGTGNIKFLLDLTNLLNQQIYKFHGSLHKEKKSKLSKLEHYSLCGKVNFSVVYSSISYSFCKLSGKATF